MPTLTIYTDPSRLGTCDVPPFVLGDSTSWTLKFNNGSAYYAPASVTMQVGNINGLIAGQTSAFKWTDRQGNYGIFDIALAANIPTLSLASSSGTAPTLVGSNGANIIRGQRVLNRVLSVVVGSGGSGYTTAPTVTIGGGGGTGATATATIGNGKVVSIILQTAGQNYGVAPTVSLSGGGGTGAAAVAILSGTSIGQVVITNPGAGYTSAPTVSFSGGTGTTATATLIPSGTNGVGGFVITNPGTGYTDAPTVTLGSPGAGASVTAVVSGGKVVGFNIINTGSGSGYTSSTTVTIGAPPAPIAPTVTAVISQEVTGINMVSNGSGYTSAPLVAITGGGGAGAVAAASVELELNKTPYKSAEATAAIIGAVEVTPYSDGDIDRDGSTIYDHSVCIVKPRTIATASLSLSGTDWVGTMDPTNAWVTSMLALRKGSISVDLQIFGDGRMLYEGRLVIRNKIS